jgi:hypothetical protein
MDNLTLNEEKVWKILREFPNGISRKRLMKLTDLPSATLYEALSSLEAKTSTYNEKRKWYPEQPSTKSSTEKPSKNRIWPLITCGLLIFFSVVFPIGFIDPSLKLLNDTIINPIKVSIPYAMWPILALIMVSFYFTSKK